MKVALHQLNFTGIVTTLVLTGGGGREGGAGGGGSLMTWINKSKKNVWIHSVSLFLVATVFTILRPTSDNHIISQLQCRDLKM